MVAEPLKKATGAARGFIGQLLRTLPEPVRLALTPDSPELKADIPAPAATPGKPIRLYVAPANFAGQGYMWARAAETLPGVGASNMAFVRPQGFAFEADERVPADVYAKSRTWQRRQRKFVNGFTHVLLEAELPLFGRGPVEDEVRRLRAKGIHVAFVSHGSDVRSPSRHALMNLWSPFTDSGHGPTAELEEVATRRRGILTELGGPVFVSTPDLLLDFPEATWLPVVIDPSSWEAEGPALTRKVPRVLHAPSRAWLKGTAEIEPVVTEMASRGLIEYERLEGIPAAQMPAKYATADIVLDQFRIGTYGVGACEAMAAGRLVISQVPDQVRDRARSVGELELPIVEATIDSLGRVLEDILVNREKYAEVAATGPAFVAGLHDGAKSARVLAPFLGVK